MLEGKARKLRAEGKGKVPHRARSLTSEEEILWSSGQFVSCNPYALIQSVWWNNCQHFGMRGRSEHCELSIDDFHLEKDFQGRRFLSFIEGPTKARQGGLNFKPRIISPKMYETEDGRCPVVLFLKYNAKRPAALTNSGPLYLSVIDKPKTNVWYKVQRMGINTINSMLKRMKQHSPLSRELNCNCTLVHMITGTNNIFHS